MLCLECLSGLNITIKCRFVKTYWTDPLLGFLPSLARRFFGERISRPTGKFRACLFTWLLLSSEIIIVLNSRKHDKTTQTVEMSRKAHNSPLASLGDGKKREVFQEKKSSLQLPERNPQESQKGV